MIPFAVTIEGVTEEGRATWVLAVSENKLLTARPDGSLHWYPLGKCRFVKLVSPEAPQYVIPVQPAPQNGIRLPKLEIPRN